MLIDREDKSKPLSDQDLVQEIEKKKKVQPSRRVIAKYRNEMRIPSSTKKKISRSIIASNLSKNKPTGKSNPE